MTSVMRVYARHHLDIGWGQLLFGLAATALPGNGEADRRIAARWLPDRHAVCCLSVRTAFDALLTALQLPPGSEIVMSAVNIAGMQGIAEHHGLVLRPVDVDPGTLAPRVEDVAAAISENTRIVLIAHLFGSHVDLAPFAALRREGLLLIEDCAQGWTPDFAGSPGVDVSLFSFGPIKTLTALGGAIAVFRDATLSAAFAARVRSYPRMSPSWYARRILKYAALKALSRPLPYGLISRLLSLSGGDLDATINGLTRGFGQNPKVEMFRYACPKAMERLIARRLSASHDLSQRTQHSAALVAHLPDADVPGRAANGHTHWVTPVLVDDPVEARRRLMAHGFDATRGTTSMRVIGTDTEVLPGAVGMMRDVLYLPSPAHIPARKLEELKALMAISPRHGPADIGPPSAR